MQDQVVYSPYLWELEETTFIKATLRPENRALGGTLNLLANSTQFSSEKNDSSLLFSSVTWGINATILGAHGRFPLTEMCARCLQGIQRWIKQISCPWGAYGQARDLYCIVWLNYSFLQAAISATGRNVPGENYRKTSRSSNSPVLQNLRFLFVRTALPEVLKKWRTQVKSPFS